MSGKQVKLFLADGTPGGLTTAEITNWTGHVVTGHRSSLSAILGRDEAARTGVYILLGEDPGALGGLACYIGEADEIRARLKSHDGRQGKGFWDRVVIITSKDANLTKAHVRYLESRLISLALKAERSTVQNATNPGPPPLPEADLSDMDYFIEQLKIVLPVLGVNVLRGRAVHTASHPTSANAPVALSPEFVLAVPKRGIVARAQQVDGEFTVLKGSLAAGEVKTGTFAASTTASYNAYGQLNQKLLDEGSLAPDGKLAAFTRDVVFSSSSTAGAIVTGRSCNGRISWKTESGLTFGEWEQQGQA